MGEDLHFYVAYLDHVVDSPLVQEKGGIQRSVCYISKAYQGAKAQYPTLEKLALALLASFKKL